MVYPLRPVWTGPTQLTEGVVVVTSAARWDAMRATWPDAVRDKVGAPAVAWDREAAVVVVGPQTNDVITTLAVGKLGRSADRVVLDVVFQGQAVDIYMPNHPTLIAITPAAAFADPAELRLTWNGQAWSGPARVDR